MLSILDVAMLHLALTEQNGEYFSLCPFHTEKTPSFSINPEKGVFFCFGCLKAGDAITLLRKLEGLSFREAAERIGKDLGPPPTQEVKARAAKLRHDFESWCFDQYLAAYRAVRLARQEYELAQTAERYHRSHPGVWDDETVGYWGQHYAYWEAEFYALQRDFLFWIDKRHHHNRIARWRETHA